MILGGPFLFHANHSSMSNGTTLNLTQLPDTFGYTTDTEGKILEVTAKRSPVRLKR